MIAVILAFVSFYLAVRVALKEITRSVHDYCSRWETTSFTIGSKTENAPPADENSPIDPLVKTHPQSPNMPPKKVCRKNANPDNFMQPLSSIRMKTSCSHLLTGSEDHYKVSYTNKMEGLLYQKMKDCASVISRVPYSSTSSQSHFINLLDTPSEDRNCSWPTRLFNHAAYFLRRNKTYGYPDVSSKVLSSDRLQLAIKTVVGEETKDKPYGSNVDDVEQKHKLRAFEILQSMKSCISSVLLSIASWVMYKLLRRMLNGLIIEKEHMETLRRTSRNNTPMIYLPLHRSHLDYIVVTLILHLNDLKAPLVAAGDNLLIPFFGFLLRGLGAFFIKRKLDPHKGKKDHIYRAVLHTYMAENLKAGHSLEFFIEGGRSRSGNSCLPKAGLLSVLMDTLIDGGIEDAYIVPVSISYDKLLDGNFISEQMGKPKIMESFTSAVNGIWRTLHSNFGYVKVDFCQPFSLKEFKQASEVMHNIQSKMPVDNHILQPLNSAVRRISTYGTDVVSEERRLIIKDLADSVVYEASKALSLMSTNLLAFLLLTEYRKGTTFQMLIHSFSRLKEEVIKRNKKVGFTGETIDVVRQACILLGKDLVSVESVQMEWSSGESDNNLKIVFYRPSVSLPHVLELQYYANAVVPVFLLESIVVNALYTALEESNTQNSCGEVHVKKTVLRQDIVTYALQLCDIFQYEFIFTEPCTSLCSAINATIDGLISETYLVDPEITPIEEWKNGIFPIPEVYNENVWNSSDEVTRFEMQHLKPSSNDEKSRMLQFLRCVLGPYIHSYWLTACSLHKLIGKESDERSFLQEIRKTAASKLHEGHLPYEESFGGECLRNALKLFQHWNVIENQVQNSSTVIRLCPPYNSRNALNDVFSRIDKFKK